MDNYYHILGVSATASQEEIKAAFKKLAKEYHPDKHRGSDSYYEEQFKKIKFSLPDTIQPFKKSQV